MTRTRSNKLSFFEDALHIFVLFGFAVAQPIFDLLSRHPESLVSWELESLHLILLIIILSFMLPLIAVVLEIIAGLFSRIMRAAVHGFFSMGLLFILVMQVLKHIYELPGAYAIAVSVITSLAATALYFRFKAARFFMTVLSPAILIFPLLFIFSPSVHKIIFTVNNSQSVVGPIHATNPVIMVVFDEFPLTSLLNKNRLIDSDLYPNFAALSRDAYWFRNTSTVAERTFAAIPAILTGLYPNKNRIPTASDFPNSLFTLLGGAYEMEVFEPDSMLCPATLCEEENTIEDFARQIKSMFLDLSLVYLHVVAPQDLAEKLPTVTLTMKGFLDRSVESKSKKRKMKKDIEKRTFLSQSMDRAQLFRDFVEAISTSKKPALYFLHVKIPHIPWEFFPSGKIYSITRWRLPGLNLKTDEWGDDEWLIQQAYQRHLLQVAYVDKLLGDLLEKVKRLDLYDRSLIVVTADHGVSFFPKLIRRVVYKKENMDILTVPLFIKTPKQHKSVISDRNVETIDILPTIADILDITFPWKIDGRSALDQTLPERKKKVVYNHSYEKFVFDKTIESDATALQRKLSLLGSSPGIDGLFKVGRYNELIGKQVSDIMTKENEGVTFVLDQESFFADVDPNASFLPGQITGRLLPNSQTKDPIYLAIAVNGAISAVSRTYQDEGKETRFSFMVSESSFKSGRNPVEVFSVSGENKALIVSRIRKSTSLIYSLDSTGIIRSAEGRTLQIVKDAVSGSLDSARVEGKNVLFHGWAADVKGSRLPDAIVIFVNGDFLYSGPCNRDRPDVVEHFGDKALKRSGFQYMFPLRLVKDIDNAEVRVFAVSKDGVAYELSNQNKGK